MALLAPATPLASQVPSVPSQAVPEGLHRERLERAVETRVHGALLAADDREREAELAAAEELSRALVSGYPDDADAWYWRAVALGVRTEYSGPFQKLTTGPDVLDATVRALELDSLHAGGHEMMGRLHAAVMRLPWVIRQLALRMGLGDALGNASWEEAERHYRVAAAQDPAALAPRLELGKLLLDRGRPDEAARWLEAVVERSPGDEVDRRLHAEGDSILAELRGEGG